MFACKAIFALVATASLLLAVLPTAAQQDPAKPGSPGKPTIPPPSQPGQPGKPGGGGSPLMPPSPGRPGEKSGDQLVRVKMSPDVARIKPGQKFMLAFIFDVEPGWHIYWENSGVSGAPTEVHVTAPPGFAVSKTQFPRPQIINSPEGLCYGYEQRTVLFVEVSAPQTAMAQISFSADVNWLVCKEICKMGSSSAMLSLPFGDPSVPGGPTADVDPIIGQYKPRLPKPLTALSGASSEFDGQTLTVLLPSATFSTAEFFPNPSPGVEFGEPTIEQHGLQFHIAVPVTLKPNNTLGKQMHVAGVVGLGRSPQDPCYHFDIPLGADGKPERSG